MQCALRGVAPTHGTAVGWGADYEWYVLFDERDDDGAATVSIFALRHAGERGRRPAVRGGGFRPRWDAPARKTSGPAESSPQQLVLQSL